MLAPIAFLGRAQRNLEHKRPSARRSSRQRKKKLMIPQHGGSSKQGPNVACPTRDAVRGLRLTTASQKGNTFYITQTLSVGAIYVLPAGYGCAAITRCESDSGMLTVS